MKGFSWAKLRGEFKINRGGSKKNEQDALEGEVGYIDRDKQLDLILKKVSESGVNSLSESEKAYLIQESERRRRGERRF